ncbi:MAG: hypothetical protein ACFWTJ_04680 [Lachnoclostridium sp.]|jgi:hypothetical protein
MINKRKKFIFVLALFGFSIWVIIGFYKINNEYPQAKKICYSIGEPGNFSEGIEATILENRWIGQKEFEDMYGKFKDAIDNSKYKFLLVSVKFKNTSVEKREVEVYRYYIECLGYSNGIGLDNYYIFNDIGIAFTLQPGKEVNVTIPYVFFDTQFKKRDWNNLENKKFYLVNTWYPVKKIWSISREI